jgi:ABC-type iron transport system FetAB permease component
MSEIKTYVPIMGMIICDDGTGSHVSKSDYDKLETENIELKNQLAAANKAAEAMENIRLCVSVLNEFNTRFKMDDIVGIVIDYQQLKEAGK